MTAFGLPCAGTFLEWDFVNARLSRSLPEGGYEYRIRDDEEGGVTLFQENRRTGEIEQRHACRDTDEAYRLADKWARNVAIARGPW